MRMHRTGTVPSGRTGAPARMAGFGRDEAANFASAALPMLFGALGLTLLAVGAVLSMVSLLVAGGGLSVVGFASYMIAASLDRGDRKAEARRAAAHARKQAAREGFAEDRSRMPAPTRSPLADDAVAALTGAPAPVPEGGVYPPLSSTHTPAASRPASTPRSGAVSHWDPGARVSAPGFEQDAQAPEQPDDGLVEFTSASGATPTPVAAAPVAQGRPQSALLEQEEPQHDFRAWPGSGDADTWLSFTGERQAKTQRYSDEDLKAAMTKRRESMAQRLPTVGAILADVDHVERKSTEVERMKQTMDRGRCSSCASMIWAPKKRPIVLKCPKCSHKAKLY